MSRVITLESNGGTIAIGGASKIRMLRGLMGTGLPPVQNQWFEGAGDGASLRGSRVLARPQSLVFKITGANRSEVWSNYESLAKVFDPAAGEVTVRVVLDGEEWFNKVMREGGGDFSWDTDTDGSTFVKTVVSTKAGDPYFTRTNATSQRIALGGLGRGLIKSTSLSKLELSTNNSFGSVSLANPGSVGVGGLWVIEGPFTGFTFTGPSGGVLEWDSAIDGYPAPVLGESITVDFDLGTATDSLGRNRFGGFVGVPNFWPIPPGNGTAQIELTDATSDSSATVYFHPKRWVLF